VSRIVRGAGAWPGLRAAREDAAAQGARSVGTQHVLLALLAPRAGEAAAVLRAAGVDRAAVLATLRAIEGVGARPEQRPIEQVTVSPRVGAMLQRASHGFSAPIEDLAVLGELLSEAGEPSLAHLVLTSLGARRRAQAAYRDAARTVVGGTDAGRTDGDLVPG
jgi:ATP-dependent Clp protease ATP-binding subunit ClpA